MVEVLNQSLATNPIFGEYSMFGSNHDDPKTHVNLGHQALCGSKSMAAMMRGVTCSRCDNRIEKMLTIFQRMAIQYDDREGRKFLDQVNMESNIEGMPAGFPKSARGVQPRVGSRCLEGADRIPNT